MGAPRWSLPNKGRPALFQKAGLSSRPIEWSAPTSCLNEDGGQNNRVGAEFDPARMNRSNNKGSDCDAGQQSDENGKYPSHYSRHAVPIDEQDVQVKEDFDHNGGGIQDAIGIKNECERHGERRKSIADGTVYEGRKQSDRNKNDQCGVEGRHLTCVLRWDSKT